MSPRRPNPHRPARHPQALTRVIDARTIAKVGAGLGLLTAGWWVLNGSRSTQGAILLGLGAGMLTQFVADEDTDMMTAAVGSLALGVGSYWLNQREPSLLQRILPAGHGGGGHGGGGHGGRGGSGWGGGWGTALDGVVVDTATRRPQFHRYQEGATYTDPQNGMTYAMLGGRVRMQIALDADWQDVTGTAWDPTRQTVT